MNKFKEEFENRQEVALARQAMLEQEQQEKKDVWLAIDLLYASVLRLTQFHTRESDNTKNPPDWAKTAREIQPCLRTVEELKNKYLEG